MDLNLEVKKLENRDTKVSCEYIGCLSGMEAGCCQVE